MNIPLMNQGGIPVFTAETTLNRLCHAAKQFNVKKDEYEEFVFVLRSIRESYHISQREMATLMNVTQGTISKFESFDLTARLDFFITYADALGYQLILTDESKDANEPSRFRERQSRISKELSDTSQFEVLSASPTQKMGIMPKSIVYEHKKRIIKRLLEARRNVEEAVYLRAIAEAGNIPDIGLSNLLPDDFRDRYAADMMAKTFRVSERMIRRFEKDDAYMPTASLAFKYAAYVRAEFRLSEKFQTPEESIGSFYMRNCLALHNTFEKPTNVLKKIQKSSDKYDEFIFVLRSIRESYQIHQGEMATLMGVSQSTISKFEAGSLDVRWDFLLLYAGFLGYGVGNSRAGRETELSRFNELQRQVSEDLLNVQIEGKYFSRVHCKTKWPAEIVELTKRSVIRELVIAKYTHNYANYEISRINKLEEIRYNGHIVSRLLDVGFSFSEKPEMSERTVQRTGVDDRPEPAHPVYIDEVEELTTDIMTKKLGISERTLRRFDNEEDYMPPAALVFKYASLVNCELQLVETRNPNESPGDFYIRHNLALYDWIENPPNVIPTGA